MKPTSLLVALLAGAIAHGAWAHGGGLDKQGCHHNRKTGDYHCHRGVSAAQEAQGKATRLPPSTAAPASLLPDSRPFGNCTEARAAGAAPVHRGDPGYGKHLDRDGDGIGCEPYRGR